MLLAYVTIQDVKFDSFYQTSNKLLSTCQIKSISCNRDKYTNFRFFLKFQCYGLSNFLYYLFFFVFLLIRFDVRYVNRSDIDNISIDDYF